MSFTIDTDFFFSVADLGGLDPIWVQIGSV